jgi:hypothetical protein
MAVWPTKIAHCFAGAFPFEHAGGRGSSPVTPCIGFVFFGFTRSINVTESYSFLIAIYLSFFPLQRAPKGLCARRARRSPRMMR